MRGTHEVIASDGNTDPSINRDAADAVSELRAVRLCHIDDIADGAAITVPVTIAGQLEEVIVVRRAADVWAYRNSCPHFSVGLDAQPGVIYTYQATVLMCAHHSALFRFEDGECIDGPCQGFRLDQVIVRVDGSHVVLAQPLDGQ